MKHRENIISDKITSYLKLARLHRPVGILLLLFPAWWGLGLASPGVPPNSLIILFALGALLMRSAGCVYNDMIDMDLDTKVTRTSSRPLAAGELTKREALVFLFLLLIGAAVILFSLSMPVILTGFQALGLVLIYPWMKRITYWPQLFLGFTFNIGILMGWLCLQPLSMAPFVFYLGAILWTVGYDTIYALQDREDDLLAGVKSSAIVVSGAPRLFLSGVYGLALIFWGVGGAVANLGWIYWVFWVIIYLLIFWQVLTLREDVPGNCMTRFESNAYIGLLLFLGIVFSHLID
jgi:4-hydroxybenzoate polyprenyltransferase